MTYHYCLPFTSPRAFPLKKLIITFANSLDLDQARHKKVGLDLHLNRSNVDPLMMFPGEFFLNEFLCKQFEPDQARHNNVRPHSASMPCADPNGGGYEVVRRTPSKISQKYSCFINWSGPLKITKLPSHILCMANFGTLAKRHLNGFSLAGR